ncbi:PilN domain-containing protein [Paraglaciecola sp.]|uniref:PilN domain-containing protein n=1 Tax=Paraglaciecola sp. TaxID=1920173 RepID=UPI0030F4A8AD
MKTKVNLYSPELHPKLRLLSLSITLLACAFVVLLFSGVWLYAFIQQQDLTADAMLSEQQKNQHLNLVKALQTELTNVKNDPQLLLDVEQNIQVLRLKKRVLQELQGQEDLKTNGFAQLMLELSENHQSGLWLSHISLDGRNVQLEGGANESSLIPKWLNNLGETAYFRGQEFAQTRVFRNEEQQLNFIIATSAANNDTVATGATSNE